MQSTKNDINENMQLCSNCRYTIKQKIKWLKCWSWLHTHFTFIDHELWHTLTTTFHNLLLWYHLNSLFCLVAEELIYLQPKLITYFFNFKKKRFESQLKTFNEFATNGLVDDKRGTINQDVYNRRQEKRRDASTHDRKMNSSVPARLDSLEEDNGTLRRACILRMRGMPKLQQILNSCQTHPLAFPYGLSIKERERAFQVSLWHIW